MVWREKKSAFDFEGVCGRRGDEHQDLKPFEAYVSSGSSEGEARVYEV